MDGVAGHDLVKVHRHVHQGQDGVRLGRAKRVQVRHLPPRRQPRHLLPVGRPVGAHAVDEDLEALVEEGEQPALRADEEAAAEHFIKGSE